MSGLGRNVAANLAGKVWVAAAGILFLPLYARALGMEAFALVGFFASLSAVIGVLDLGLIATVDREIARLSADTSVEGARAMRDLVRTFELVFWGVGALTGLVIVAIAPLVARYWLNSQRLPADEITRAVRLMGVIIALQWPFATYSGCLVGLQHQVATNALQIAATTLRTGGTLLLLWIAPTIEAFFLWQLATMVLHTVASQRLLARALPAADRAGQFHAAIVVQNWRFSVGMSGISLVGVAMAQVDRVLLSKLLTLADFGYYSMASTVGRSLGYLIAPVFSAIYPRLCQLVAQKNDVETRELYHTASQTIAIAIIPPTVILGLFSKPVLLAWSNDPVIAEHTFLIVSAIAIGTGLSGLTSIAYALQLAEGWTSLPFWVNAGTLAFLVPATAWGTTHYGAVGAAASLPIVSLFYVAAMMVLTHRRYLVGAARRWLVDDVGKALVAGVVAVVPCKLLWPASLGRVETVLLLCFTGALSLAATVIATPVGRRRLAALRASRVARP